GAAPAERERFEHALGRARRELDEIALRVAFTAGKSAAAIFTAHGQLLNDPALVNEILRRIEVDHLAAETAVHATIEEKARRAAALGNGYLAARADDLNDLGRRLLTHLRKEGPAQMPALTRRRSRR